MPAPSIVPTWATGGGAYKSDPGGSKRALGWLAGEKPAADWFNFDRNLVGLWLTWLSASTLTSEAGATYSVRTLVHEFADPSGNPGKTRFYANSDPSTNLVVFQITQNCSWNGSNWVPDASGAMCARVELLGGSRLAFYFFTAVGTTPFSDTDFNAHTTSIDSSGLSTPGVLSATGNVLAGGNVLVTGTGSSVPLPAVTAFSYGSGWSAQAGYSPGSYKNAHGEVVLHQRVTRTGGGSGTVIATLAAGSRPLSGNLYFPCWDSVAAALLTVRVDTDGTVNALVGGSATILVDLSPIRFRP